MSALVIRKDIDGIAILSLNRPDALNALSPSLFVELHEHVKTLSQETESIGCVILRGEGRSFSAGNDLKAMQAGEAAPHPRFQAETIEMIEDLPQPVIAEVRGHCYTGALELALASDLTICSESAKFADTHGKWALTPLWGMSQRLPRRIGVLNAKEMMFTGRVVSGTEAAEIGLVNKCVPDSELSDATLEMAHAIVENSWHTLRADKMLVNKGQNYGLKDGLNFERENSPGRATGDDERLSGFKKV
ncbi:enoyl-CoA hydratase/isomerase family protein [Sneathiella sp. HT1-7]|uniref:enoyl-CoA hydratase/isomerase family protein n=1 Tax=Sneathiella sp. HT1-7 TaxID=2887192 RepID=UPI001D1465A5|nr:enoyl-CoA hydratase/isomerase family protein [Sneathiella sp. HT1-7]MCC3306538.1 enoyl-CoA hydratase/isomerase family protein [Sneathiella sp. HT1-7]